MSATRSSEVTSRPCVITETGRVLPLPPKRTPSRVAKAIKLPTKRFGPVFSATEVQESHESHQEPTHKRKTSPSPQKAVVTTRRKRKKKIRKHVSPRLNATKDPTSHHPKKNDVDSIDHEMERLSVTSFSQSDSYIDSDSPRLNGLPDDAFQEGDEGVRYRNASPACAVLFPENERGGRDASSSVSLPRSLNMKIQSRNVTEVLVNLPESTEGKGLREGRDGSQTRLLVRKHSQIFEPDVNSLLNDPQNIVVHNNWHLHLHTRLNKLSNHDVSPHVEYIEDHRGPNLARLTHFKGRNSWEHSAINTEAAGRLSYPDSAPLRNGSPHTETLESSVAGRELAPLMPSLQGIQQRGGSHRGGCIHFEVDF